MLKIFAGILLLMILQFCLLHFYLNKRFQILTNKIELLMKYATIKTKEVKNAIEGLKEE